MKNKYYLSTLFSLLFFISLFIFAACENSNAPVATAEVSGKLVANDSKPVEGALVEVVNSSDSVIFSDVTKNDGSFSLSGLPENKDKIEVRFCHPDYDVLSEPLTKLMELPGESGRHVVRMIIEDGSCGLLSVSVVDKSSEAGIKGAEVRLVLSQKIIRKERTNADGLLTYKNLALGDYWVRVAREGYKTIEENLSIKSCEPTSITFKMESLQQQDSCCNGVLKLKVQDSLGKPVPYAYVKMYQHDNVIREAKANEDGYVEIKEICKGEYRIVLMAEGYNEVSWGENFGCNQTITREKTLYKPCCNGVIKLWMKDAETGEILKNCEVALRKGSQTLTTIRQEGEYVIFTGLCEGEYNLRIAREGYKVVEFEQKVACNDNLEITKLMEKKPCCNGIAKIWLKNEANQEILKNCTIILRKDGKQIAQYNQEGEYFLLKELCEGTYQIDASREGYKSMEFTFTIKCDDNLEITKQMARNCCNGVIKLWMKDAETGEILKNCEVALRKGSQTLTTIRQEGEYVIFTGLCEGEYNLRIAREGYKVVEFEQKVACNDNLEITKLMEKKPCCDGILNVLVRNANGEKMKGAVVRLWQNGTKLREVYADDNGAVKFGEICEGTYAVSINKDGYKELEYAVEIHCHDNLTHEKKIELKGECCTGVLKLKIIDKETEKAIENATVKVYVGDDVKYDGKSNGEGWFTKEGICAPKTYKIVVSREGYADNTFSFTYNECKTMQETVRLSK